MRLSIRNPLTGEEFEGSGEFTTESSASSYGQPVWDIRLDNGDRFALSEAEAVLYRLEALQSK